MTRSMAPAATSVPVASRFPSCSSALATLRHAFQTISTHTRFEPCEADVSQRWDDAHFGCSRGLVRLRLRHDTLHGDCRYLFCGSRIGITFRVAHFRSVRPLRACPRHAPE